MSPVTTYEDQEFDYQVRTGSTVRSTQGSGKKQPRYGRSGKAPQSFNGMHRRRRRKWAW